MPSRATKNKNSHTKYIWFVLSILSTFFFRICFMYVSIENDQSVFDAHKIWKMKLRFHDHRAYRKWEHVKNDECLMKRENAEQTKQIPNNTNANNSLIRQDKPSRILLYNCFLCRCAHVVDFFILFFFLFVFFGCMNFYAVVVDFGLWLLVVLVLSFFFLILFGLFSMLFFGKYKSGACQTKNSQRHV